MKTIRRTIEKANDFLDNPIIVAIVEKARSPRVAFNYVTNILGWPKEIGEQMGELVRVREQFGQDLWLRFKQSDEPIPEAMISGYDAWPYGHSGAYLVRGLNFGNFTIDHSQRPFLLRHFKLGTRWSTLNADRICKCRVLHDSEFDYSDVWVSSCADDGEEIVETNSPNLQCCKESHGGGHYHLDARDNAIKVHGKLIAYRPHDTLIPEFYRAVVISLGKINAGGVETVSILLREELNRFDQGRCQIGWMTYKNSTCIQNSHVHATLRAHYDILPDFGLRLRENGSRQITTEFLGNVSETPFSSSNTRELDAVNRELRKVANKLFQFIELRLKAVTDASVLTYQLENEGLIDILLNS